MALNPVIKFTTLFGLLAVELAVSTAETNQTLVHVIAAVLFLVSPAGNYVTGATLLIDGGTSLLGGRFSLRGSVLGALIIQTLTTSIYSLGVPPEINLVVKAVVVFAVCLVQSPELRSWLTKRRVAA